MLGFLSQKGGNRHYIGPAINQVFQGVHSMLLRRYNVAGSEGAEFESLQHNCLGELEQLNFL